MYRKSYEVVGIVGDASWYCLPCASKTYGQETAEDILYGVSEHADREGNTLGVIFLDNLEEDFHHCTECGADLYESPTHF